MHSAIPSAPESTESSICVKVRFLINFPAIFGAKEKSIRLSPGSKMGDLLRRLGDTPERLRELLVGEQLNAQVVILKNGASIQSMEGLDTELADGDTVAIFPFLAGG